MLITEEVLVEAGYLKYTGPYGVLMQKIVSKDGETLYLIYIRFGRQAYSKPLSKAILYCAEEATKNFQVEFDILPQTSIERLEAFYARLYNLMGCIPDPYNKQ